MDKIKRMELESKVQAWLEDKKLPEYTCALVQRGNKVCLEIKADKKTWGTWKWYLTTLFENEKMDDILSLDFGQKWYVTGMKKVYQEVIAKYQIPA